MDLEVKPQHQTLSIRISSALREFLEISKQVISNGRGESVSTSDVAKILLESAKDDRLDFRLEVAELQQRATEAMWEIRRKWAQEQDLSRAEWLFLSLYIQVACEGVSGDPSMPTPAAFARLLDAVLDVRRLRKRSGVELDRYYLGNLGAGDKISFNDRQIEPSLVPSETSRWIALLRTSPAPPKPTFAGRNFYVAIRDEELPDIVALNSTLRPYMETLFRLAARGHWMRERRPVRSPGDGNVIGQIIPPVLMDGFHLEFQVTGAGDVSILIVMQEKDVTYPLRTYPEIREFSAMLGGVGPNQQWIGVDFRAYTEQESPTGPLRYYFHNTRNGIVLGFSLEEWQKLKEAFWETTVRPELQDLYKELSLVYGEL